MNTPKLWDFFKVFFYIGLTGYGWPAVLGQMKKILVHKNNWMTEKEFMEALSICQILPGATGVTLSWYLWFRFFWILWTVLMSFAYIFPPFVFIVLLSYYYLKFWDLTAVQAIMRWLWALVVALIFNAIFQIGWGVFKKISLKDYKWLIIVLFAFIVTFFFHQVNILLVILGSWILWFLMYYFTWEFEHIADTSWQKITKTPYISKKIHDYYLIWLLMLLAIAILSVPMTRQIFSQFFIIWISAFGGWFTVIPIIQHQIVDVLHWLNLQEFRDGIALWQITPGSFLISAAFIGYKIDGLIGATVATLAIFSPSIILITSLSKIHTKIKEMRTFIVITKWFITWFLGILVSTVISFWKASLIDYKTWLICLLVFVWVRWLKKDPIWAILATIIVSFFIF